MPVVPRHHRTLCHQAAWRLTASGAGVRVSARSVTVVERCLNDEGEEAWTTLVGLAEIDEEKSIKAYVAEALRQVDWMKQATEFVS